MSGSRPPRVALIDVLKALASQLIVLHHLAYYGPMSDVAWPLAPTVWSWLADDARIAVQVFLVVGGFLAARGLAPQGWMRPAALGPALWNRYVRLVFPYGVMLVLATLASGLARQWMTHDSISAAPSWPQWIAHLLLVQGLLDYESLSAGVWYVAIDMQLFALLLLMLSLARNLARGRGMRAGQACAAAVVGAGVLAALFHFNLDAGWDRWALYFFGSYGLGVAAWWGSNRDASRRWMGFILLVGGLALAYAWRDRLAVAVVVALALTWARRSAWRSAAEPVGQVGLWGRALGALGQMSYSLFLVHFPVCLVVNALFVRFVPPTPLAHLGGVLLAWALSLLCAWAFHLHVERHAGHFAWPGRQAARPQGA